MPAPFQGWKPISLGPWVLLPTAILTTLLAILLEYLCRYSQQHGGIAFAEKEFDASVTFAYLYFPTILAVLLGLLWSWVDLDAKRLEPYFQMSKRGGAPAKDSTMLHYPFDFIAFAPIKAFRHRHWSVFMAGTAMMLLFWAVTPLTSACFAVAIVSTDLHSSMTTRALLTSPRDQYDSLTSSFILRAYSHVWLGQELPGFVTQDSVLQPFRAEKPKSHESAKETWTSATTRYSSSLECKPAIVHPGRRFDNGKGCITDPGYFQLDNLTKFMALYIGYHENLYTDYALSRLGCSSIEFIHTFLAIVAYSVEDTERTAAIFCEPSYWQQNVNVTMAMPTASVVSMVPIGPKRRLSDGEFNRTNFELFALDSAQRSERADIPDTINVLEQASRLQQLGIERDSRTTTLAALAIGATQLEIPKYLDTDLLARSLEKAHSLLFVLAMRGFFSFDDASQSNSSSTIAATMSAVIVVRTLALVVECCLGIVSLLALALLCASSYRKSQLLNDPAALRDILTMMGYDRPRNDALEFLSEQTNHVHLVRGRIADYTYSTECHDGIAVSRGNTSKRLVRPNEMRLWVASLFICLLTLAIIALLYTQLSAEMSSGLPVPSKNTLVTQLVTNYVPIVFATFLEPVWLSLNRMLCVLRPFEELRLGNARPSRSIDLKYTSLPPQLVFWRALKAGHLVLAAVCAIGFSANILSVALGSLYNLRDTVLESPLNMSIQSLPYLQDTYGSQRYAKSSDSLYVAHANITSSVRLPPWTSHDGAFIPFVVNNITRAANAHYKAVTRGFNAEVRCVPVDQNTTDFIVRRDTSNIYRTINVGVGRTCSSWAKGPFGGQNNSAAALEVFQALGSVNESSQSVRSDCNNKFLAGFIRANLSVSAENIKTEYNPNQTPDILATNSVSATWMVCTVTLIEAQYEIVVDREGYVQSAERRGPSPSFSAVEAADEQDIKTFINQTSQVLTHIQDTAPYWHNDTWCDSWFGYLIKGVAKSDSPIDPSRSVPTYSEVEPLVQDLYTRLFSITLGLNMEWLVPAPANTTTAGSVLTISRRVLVSQPAFVISLSLLGLNLMVVVLYYVKRPRRLLFHLPTTLDSVFRLFEGSGLIGDAQERGKLKEDVRLAYGKFVGTDGKPRVGIDRQRYVIA